MSTTWSQPEHGTGIAVWLPGLLRRTAGLPVAACTALHDRKQGRNPRGVSGNAVFVRKAQHGALALLPCPEAVLSGR